MNYELLGQNIRQARKKQSMTQELLAETVDLSTVFISQIENGARKPSLETVYNIAKVLGVTIDGLLANNESQVVIEPHPEIELLLHNRTEAEVRLITDVTREILRHLKEENSKK